VTQSGSARPLTAVHGIDELVSAALKHWSWVWSSPELPTTVTVRFNRRLRRSLGRAALSTGRISLHPSLCESPPALIREILCHEVAHVVAYRQARRHGSRRIAAHGEEWRALVRAAGYEPLVRGPALSRDQPRQRAPAITQHYRVAHVCPVCQTRRLARRAVPAWRCATCVAAGLDGCMEVIRLRSHE
jgi:predicted SprT family Zn-dependent metalloprotease